jgi:tetratricopeptide (TPR) repeat protein
MPSHIFLQLGMWPETAASNESAWESSDNWMKRKKLSLSVRDYHSLHWLLYAYLQQGRYRKAEELLQLMKKVMSESTYDNKLRPGYYENNYANMAAAFIVETERWNLATEFFPPSNPENTSVQTPASGGHGGHTATPTPTDTLRYSGAGRTLPVFVRALSASIRGSNEVPTGLPEIRELEVAAVKASIKTDHEKAIELIRKAAELEEQGPPPSGPPSLIKPAHELFGEILLRAGKPVEAAAQFKTALLRQPNRARSLLGAARAATQSGDHATAAAFYLKLLEQWTHADGNLPELSEARSFLTPK